MREQEETRSHGQIELPNELHAIFVFRMSSMFGSQFCSRPHSNLSVVPDHIHLYKVLTLVNEKLACISILDGGYRIIVLLYQAH